LTKAEPSVDIILNPFCRAVDYQRLFAYFANVVANDDNDGHGLQIRASGVDLKQ
jgi:hypothetical protein